MIWIIFSSLRWDDRHDGVGDDNDCDGADDSYDVDDGAALEDNDGMMMIDDSCDHDT